MVMDRIRVGWDREEEEEKGHPHPAREVSVPSSAWPVVANSVRIGLYTFNYEVHVHVCRCTRLDSILISTYITSYMYVVMYVINVQVTQLS